MMILALLLAAAKPQPGELKTFKDWVVGCDNVRTCHATSLMPENGDWDKSVAISIQRDGAAAAAPKITIIAGGDTPTRLIADGAPLPIKLTAGESDWLVAAADTPAMLSALKSGKSIELKDGQGTSLGSVSLAGVSAALLHMDTIQKRVGTVTALARPGPLAASTIPSPPPLPLIRSAAAIPASPIRVSAKQIEDLRSDGNCKPEDPDWPGYGAEQEPLDADHTLILLGCGAGAYNYSSVPYIAVRKAGKTTITLAAFDVDISWGEGLPMLVNAAWVSDGAVLTSFAKGRGIGDCGVGNDFAWDGSRFRLVQRIEMSECRGSLDYITTWRARLVSR